MTDILISDSPVPVDLAPPHGLQAIIAAFGDPTHILAAGTPEEHAWAAAILTPITLPSPLMGGRQYHLGCHRKVAQGLQNVFRDLNTSSLWPLVKTAECYCFRPSRTTHKLSTHSWAIAVDINAATNPLGIPGDMDPRIVSVFESHQWIWGGRWPTVDGMHFQYASGY